MDVNQVLKKIDNKSYFKKHIPGLNLNGKKQVKCHCPLHDDKNPSLSIDIEQGLFQCFGCGEKGNAIQFMEKLRGVDFKTALKIVKEEEGIVDVSVKPPMKKATKQKSNSKPNYLSLEQIKAIHRQLLRDEIKLKGFQEKYGLTIDTIKERYIGYQDGSYVIPREIKPDKWSFKNHKSYQLAGSTAGLYPNNDLKKDQPVIITEGEFKALLLVQKGFQARCGTGGAGTWKKEWNTALYGLDVVLAYDNDEAGRKGTEIITECLKGYARSIRVVEWPSYMENEDVTDFFIKHGNAKEGFQELIDGAREVGYKLKEIDGVAFIQPGSFFVEKDHIKHINYYKEKSVPITVFHSTLFITGRAIDVDNSTEEVQLAFKRDGVLRKFWTPRKIIADSRKIIELSENGLSINSCNSKKIVEYLSAFEACNMLRIPKKLIARGVGWKTIKGKRMFLLGGKATAKTNKQTANEDNISIEFRADPGFERFVKAMNPQGSFSKWVKSIEPTLKYPGACFALYASFSAPLLRILKAPNFIVDFWGRTSVGKTTALELASSIWGNPHKESGGLVFSWDSTKVYLERMANFFCDVPIFPDDSQTVDDKILRNTLYMVANGVGKGRGSVTGIRYTPSWHTVCFSTGERPLTECTTFAGARARTIEIFGSPFPDVGGEFISDLKKGIRENYGHAGKRYIEGITSLLNKEEEIDQLRKDYSNYQRELSKVANTEVGDRYSHYFATVKIAANLAHRILGFGDPVEIDESIYKVFEGLVNEDLGNVDISTRMMELFISWACSNEKSFAKQDSCESDTRESYGLWREGEFIAIYPHKLHEILTGRGYSERTALKGWAEKGWIKRNGKNLTVPQRVNHKATRRLVTVPWNVFEKFVQN
jgi:putative DNA primase/helicase